jgi:hypothetical protein
MTDFFRTQMGQRFFSHDMPNLVKQIERVATALEAGASAPVVPAKAHSVETVKERELNRFVYNKAGVAALRMMLELDHMMDEAVEVLLERILNADTCLVASGELDIPPELEQYLDVAGWTFTEELQARIQITARSMNEVVALMVKAS